MLVIRANAGLAEMKGVIDAITQRLVSLAGDLAIAHAENKRLQKELKKKTTPVANRKGKA